MVGRTTLIVAHRLSTVIAADQIALTSGGVVVDVGRHEEMLGRCTEYQELVRRQIATFDGDAEPLTPAGMLVSDLGVF